MFSFFSRKVGGAAASPERAPPPGSDVSALQNDEASLHSEPTASSSKLNELAQAQLQMETDTPPGSAHSPGRPPSPSPAPTASNDSNNATYGASARRLSPSLQAESQSMPSPPEATPESLTALITSVPAKTLHAYVLAHLPNAAEPTLQQLSVFFTTLVPPPKLHCVRCHKDYMEVENDDRSCLVAHDDESAEVERVGRTAEARRTAEGTSYETIWGCCGKITEGDGSQGPPDGWCYEGRHTTDIKRARFRADSTLLDDKLVSCLRLNCHDIRSQLPRSNTRKRARANYKEESSDEDGSEGETDSGIEEITGNKTSKRRKGKAPAKAKAKSKEDDAMEVDSVAESASRAGSVRGKGRARVPSSKAKAAAESASAPVPPKRPRGRPRKSAPAAVQQSEAPSVSAQDPTTSSPAHARTPITPATPNFPTAAASSSISSSPMMIQQNPSPSSGPMFTLTPMSATASVANAAPDPSSHMVMIQEKPTSEPVLMLAPLPSSVQLPPSMTAPRPTPTKPSSSAPRKRAAPVSSNKKRRQYKSKEFIEDSDVELEADGGDSPAPSVPSTPSANEAPPLSGTPAQGGAQEGKPKKKRKV